MNKQDREETRQMIKDLITPYHLEVVNQNKLTNVSLNFIDKHLEVLNGNVAKHEKIIIENLPHTTANCAQKTTIVEIRDNMITTTALKKATRNTIILTASIFSVLFIVFQMLIKLKII
jgi:hypothetical protein